MTLHRYITVDKLFQVIVDIKFLLDLEIAN